MDEPKLAKSCDECKSRKVRCYVPANADSPFCNNCRKRGIPCQFGPRKKRGRPSGGAPRGGRPSGVVSSRPIDVVSRIEPSRISESPASEANIQTRPSNSPGPDDGVYVTRPRKLFVDHLLDDDLEVGQDQNGGSLLKAHDNYVGSSNIAIFSDKKIASISTRLGHERFHSLFNRLNDSMSARARRDIRSTNSATNTKDNPAALQSEMTTDSVREYIRNYFQYVHPVYPFLHREDFEKKAFDQGCPQLCEQSPGFSALYHTVLALGCQRKDGGSFLPGQGKAWMLFQVALNRFTEIVTSKETLLHAQAVAAMAIFGRNVSCVQIEKLLTTEAARIAQALGINRAIYKDTNTDECRRTFWVIYILEKTQCFACGRDSILNDSNISTPIPEIPETPFYGFDCFRVLCRFSRIVSKMQKEVFSISATLLPRSILICIVERLEEELENWKDSITKEYRPGDECLLSGMLDLRSIELKVRISFHYYSAVIALSRLNINIMPSDCSAIARTSEEKLLNASRAIIELTRLIGVESHTPISMLLSVPLSATFIIFDFIIHNPLHIDTKTNLALLGVASGYFSRVEISSKDTLQTSLLSELGQIARDYIKTAEDRLPAGLEPYDLFASRYSFQGDSDTNAQSSSSNTAHESLQPMQGPPQEHRSGEEFLSEAIHGDLSTLAFEPAFADGVDLTSFFAAEMRDFFDASAMDIFSEQ